MVWKNKGDKENNTFVVGAPEKEERENEKKPPLLLTRGFSAPLFSSLFLSSRCRAACGLNEKMYGKRNTRARTRI